jgi:phage shock protein A
MTQNEKLHHTLLDVHRELKSKMEAAKATATKKELFKQMNEVGHRITIVGSLVFDEDSKAVSDAVGNVEKSRDDLKKAIAEIEKLNNVIKTVTAFLGLVDTAIGLARKVAL